MPVNARAMSYREVKAEIEKHLKTSAAENLINHLNSAHTGLEPPPGRQDRQPDARYRPADAPPAPSSYERPVMTVQQFLAGNYLEPGDVVVMTRLGSFFAWLLKTFNNSKFAHAAMVYQTPEQEEGIEQTFLIEASMAGVEIVSLSQFLIAKEDYAKTGLPADFVVGVRRLEKSWMGTRHRRIVASRMLNFIENHEYNFRLLAALSSRRTRHLYFRLINSLSAVGPGLGEFLKGGGNYVPRRFICSGFVQYAYVNMIAAAAKKGIMSADQAARALEDVLFLPRANTTSKIEVLLACTPKFLAETDKLTWKYLIHNGEVFHVSTPDEAYSFFEKTLPQRIPEAKPA
jgi:hypothetical protein